MTDRTLWYSPMLFLNASNDQHGNLDYVFDTFDSMPAGVPWRVAITPRFRHHIAAAEGNNLLLWMETWLKGSAVWPREQLLSLWPPTPVAALLVGADDGIPRVQLEAAASDANANEIERVVVYYNIGQAEPKARHWREVSHPHLILTQSSSSSPNPHPNLSQVEPPLVGPAEGRVIDDELWGPGWRARRWTVQLPTIDPALHMVSFVNVHYKNGIVLTAPLVEGVPSEIRSVILT